MNDFLDRIFFDNSIRSYALVALVILFVLILKKFIAQYLAALLFRGVKKIWKGIDGKSFSGLVAQPLGMFLLILVSIASLHKLKFPELLNADIYKYSVKDVVQTSGIIILIIAFVRLLLRIIDFIALILEMKADLTSGQSDNQLIIFFKDFFKAGIIIIGILMIIRLGFGFNISSLITGLSIATAAIALATRESLENLIASFIIFFDKPFTIGDLVKVQNVTGTVEKIGLRSTRIRTDQKTFVTVPNKQMVDSLLDNLSLRTQRKGEIRLEIGLNTSPETLQQFIDKIKLVLTEMKIEQATVFLNDIKPDSFLIYADFFTAPISIDEFNQQKQQKSLEILKLMDELKIELAGASKDIRISGKL